MVETKHLFLLRHAKSSWEDLALADHDRPLAPRGRKAAKLIEKHLQSSQIEISLVLCSSARRARQTVELVNPSGQIRIEPGLYEASADQLLRRLHRVPDEVEALMLVGHNPAIQELAVGLLGSETELAAAKFPTGALATLRFAGAWRELRWGAADLAAFVTPKELR
jgi:phosphohistidine phosphatase